MNDDTSELYPAGSTAAIHAAFNQVVQALFEQTGLNLHLCDGAAVRNGLSRLGNAWLTPCLERCAQQVRDDPRHAYTLAAAVESLAWHVPGAHPETALEVLASPHAITQLTYAIQLLGDCIQPLRYWLPACSDLRPALALDRALVQAVDGQLEPTWIIKATGITTPEGAPRSGTVQWQDHCALFEEPLPACDLIVAVAVLVPMRADLRRRWLENVRSAVSRSSLLWLDNRVLPSAGELARGAGWVRMGKTDLWCPAPGARHRTLAVDPVHARVGHQAGA